MTRLPDLLVMLFLFIALLFSACAERDRDIDTSLQSNSNEIWECYHARADESFTFKKENLTEQTSAGCYGVKDDDGYKRVFCLSPGNQDWICKGKAP